MIKRLVWGTVLGVAAWLVWRSRTRSSEYMPYTPPLRTPLSSDPSIYSIKPSPLEQVKETVSSKVDEAKVAAADLKDTASEKFGHVKEVVATKVDEAKVVATDLKDATQTKLHDVKDSVEHKATHLQDKAADKLTDAKDAAAGLQDTAEDKLADAKDATSAVVADLHGTAEDKLADAKDATSAVVADLQDTAEDRLADAKDAAMYATSEATAKVQDSTAALQYEVEDGFANHSQPTSLNVYCVRCHEHRTLENPKIEITSNGRRAARGICPVCNANVFTFLTQNSDTSPKT